MTYKHRLENPLYLNWIRGALGLEHLQRGLRGFVDRQVKEQHKELTTTLHSKLVSSSDQPRVCRLCTLENLLPEHAGRNQLCPQRTKLKCFCKTLTGRRKCPNGICSQLYDLIVISHAFREPFWQNTDPKSWLTDPWSIARCFLTSMSYTSSAKDTDAAGLLSIIVNNLFVQKELAATICPGLSADPFSKARESRNEILHCPTLELQDDRMKDFLDVFIEVLQDKKNLASDVSALHAVENLEQLKSCQIYLSLKDELHIREEALKAIEEKKSEALTQIEFAQADALTQLSIQETSNATYRAKVDENQEKIVHISSKLNRIETLEERIKQSETLYEELEATIELNQEDIQRQLEAIATRANMHEQIYAELQSQVKTLQQDFEAMKVSIADLQGLKAMHTKRIEGLKKQAGLQVDLVALYQQYYLKTDISPILPEEDIDVEEVYVPLLMERFCSHEETVRQRGIPIYFFEDMFFYRQTSFKNIFLTADAGVGKTTLCRKLTSTWCKVHSCQDEFLPLDSIQRSKFRTNDNIESENNLTMKKFTYLFYVSLRHTNDETSIEEMIRTQLLSEHDKDLLTTILDEQSDKCLVILDGLDEWNTPSKVPKTPFISTGLPYREVKRPYVTFYTTRPWKLENIRPKSGEIDAEIKLLGIDTVAAAKLAKTVVEKLNDISVKKNITNAEDFIVYLDSKELRNLISIPILLKLLACLWHEEHIFGSSLCGLYASVIDLLFRLAIERSEHDERFIDTLKKLKNVGKGNLPDCFDRRSNCKDLVALLKILSSLAFKALFENDQKASLVFEGSDLTRFGLSRDEMYFCLKSGLLSQRLLLGKSAINRCKSVTFLHKTFQEFFAALYIVSSENAEVLNTVFDVCNSVERVLEMTKVIQFIGGMSPHTLFKISKHVTVLTDRDARFQSYRSIDSARIFIIMVQELLFMSIKEAIDCGNIDLPQFKLRDVHLWDENMNDYVLYVDPAGMKSLSSNAGITTAVASQVSEANSLQLFCYSGLFGTFQKDLFFEILDRSSKTLICLNIKSANIELPHELKFAKMQMLTKVLLSDVTVDHSTLMRLLSDSLHLRECIAMCVYCFKDKNCKCDSQSSSEGPDSVNLINTSIQRFDCKYGCQMFRHVGKAENLRELKIAHSKEPEILTEMTRIIRSSRALENLYLHDITPEVLSFSLPKNLDALCCIQLSEISITMESVLTLLTDAKFTPDSFTVRFDDVKLISGHTDEMKDVIEHSKTFKVDGFKKRWKRRGNVKRAMYKQAPARNLETVFSMVLSKRKNNV